MKEKNLDNETQTAMEHELKTDPEVFDAVARREKTFEIRFDDRGFQVGDSLLLRRTKHTGYQMRRLKYPLIFTGEQERRTVTHVLRGSIYGLADGWVILSFRVSESRPVSASPQISEAAIQKAEQEITDLIFNRTISGAKAGEIIRRAVDAATAEVKKEDGKDSGFADNTDAVYSNSREETGLLPCPFCGSNDVRISSTLVGKRPLRDDAHIWCETCEGFDVYRDTREEAIEYWNKRAASQSTPSQTPAAPSRKQEPGEVANRLASVIRKCVKVKNGTIGQTELSELIQRHFDAAARVEPTKEKKESL